MTSAVYQNVNQVFLNIHMYPYTLPRIKFHKLSGEFYTSSPFNSSWKKGMRGKITDCQECIWEGGILLISDDLYIKSRGDCNMYHIRPSSWFTWTIHGCWTKLQGNPFPHHTCHICSSSYIYWNIYHSCEVQEILHWASQFTYFFL